ncbi:MAG: cytochrome c oxidase subunit II [Acidobacteriota bacterium]
MQTGVPLFPEQASTVAAEVDALYIFLVVITAFFSILISGMIIYFAIKYRRRSESEIPKPIHGSTVLEAAWIIIPLIISMVVFVWGVDVFFKLARAPVDAIEIYVVGKQWMWKIQHIDGQREINELHIPVGRAVRLTLASEDVIHSFYVPAFRVKADVVPGRYTRTWFEATKPGRYHLFCAEYCGTKHSGMIGEVVVMEPAQYENWLSGGRSTGSLASQGENLFQELACNSCHREDSQARGPSLKELFGKPVQLQNGSTVTADESYIRESILTPNAKVVAGFDSIMPTFQGLITEEQTLQLIAYIRSLAKPPTGIAQPSPALTPTGPQTSKPLTPQPVRKGVPSAKQTPTK